ncbi:MAG: GAF domain-containing sensor histidine kinase, partial [Candidatus Omnitrophota bacterium]
LFGADKWWWVPMGLLTILATAGPFIYIFINKKAEDRLLREQRQYQNTLRQASSGMIRVRELQRLLSLIVHVVTRTVKLEFASIFLLDADNGQYKMAAKRDAKKLPFKTSLEIKCPLIEYLYLNKEPLVFEEINLRAQDNPRDSKIAALVKQFTEIKAEVVVPSYVGNKLLGFIVLGKKLSRKLFSQDDLNVFSVLANQAALAIENAQFYEDIKETQEQLFQAEKMATIGTMADGLSHQINNRFQALSLISGDSLDILKTTDVSNCSDDVKDAFGQLKYAFERVQSNVMQGGEIVRGLLKYSRPGDSGFELIDFNRVIDGAMEMAQYKVRIKELDFKREIPNDLPKIKCNLTQLEEIFFNMIDNAYDAIKERQAFLKDANYKGKITISVAQEDGFVRIIFQDNGMGVKDKDKEKLFTPFFTTKATNRKGTGLGLYVIQKIVGFHNGAISINSVYNQGTTFDIRLPLAQKGS